MFPGLDSRSGIRKDSVFSVELGNQKTADHTCVVPMIALKRNISTHSFITTVNVH